MGAVWPFYGLVVVGMADVSARVGCLLTGLICTGRGAVVMGA